MKFFVRLFAVVFLFSSTRSLEAQSASSTLTVGESATISQPIRIYKISDLSFGTIIAGPAGGNIQVRGTMGSVSVPSSGNPTVSTTTSINYPGGSGPSKYGGSVSTGTGFAANAAPQVACMVVTGEPSLSYSICVSGGTSVCHSTLPGCIMNLVLDPPCGGAVNSSGTSGMIQSSGETGTDKFTIGGTLTVGSIQASGSYSGAFSVTVAYN